MSGFDVQRGARGGTLGDWQPLYEGDILAELAAHDGTAAVVIQRRAAGWAVQGFGEVIGYENSAE